MNVKENRGLFFLGHLQKDPGPVPPPRTGPPLLQPQRERVRPVGDVLAAEPITTDGLLQSRRLPRSGGRTQRAPLRWGPC